MAFRVGQEVVCVDDTPNPCFDRCSLKRGQIYTIIFISDDGLGVCVAEAEPHPDAKDFFASRFRPIVKTDISIFTAMLAPSPKQRVDA